MDMKPIGFSLLITTVLCATILIGQISGEALRLPDQQSPGEQQQAQTLNFNHVQQVYQPQPQQQPQQQAQQTPPSGGEGRSSIFDIFGLGGGESDPYLARTNSNCLTGDLSECFKNQALSSFDEIFYRNSYPSLTEFARIVRLPETQQRSLLSEPFEYSEEPRNDDSDWDQMVKYALRRAERFIKSTALEVEVPEELTEAGRYEARFIGNDIDSELDIIEEKHASTLKRKKLKKLIIPLLLVLKIFKLKLLLFLPFILGIVGLKKVLSLAAIILPGVFAYFKFCRPPGGHQGGGLFSGLFGAKESFTQYSPQGVGPATYYHHHDHYEHGGYRPEPQFSKPYGDYYSKNYQESGSANTVSFGNAQDAAYSGYYGRSTGKDIESTQKS
ncbi:uncharacterized protein LOC101899972 isoform X1 [Musca domestica]|uniref:Uncharacterized protein LOC101899972 isoform X1 n=1 Tax=Musca domestica TaxID=7370 RepID=A0A9J7DH44_MUSDO|nr:uncharacterized protein LOC101899972 isoform X1 [Musca domestica]XP_019891880.2 uncharacterized protein LOC101899972 isoform X1 [Musca domestica]XP_058984655.1 uncharacterized protein LOC101899972 isoform X1 [Musca domestica]